MATPDLHALLIAADCYLPNQIVPDGTYPSLLGCVRDVVLVEEFLRSRLGLTDANLIKLTSTNDGTGKPPEPPERRPTYENLVAAFRQLGKRAKKGDHVYIHYSGHGGRTKPTILPDVKGAGSYDEALVPIDIGNSAARYLRDVELAKLLQELVEAELVVTVVFDCCHSGGATRGIDAGVRGVDQIDNRPVAASDVGTPKELRAAWLRSVGGDGTRGLTGATTTPEYTLLAACRPQEKANEFAFDGKQRNGALTYWLLDALRGGTDQTFKMVYDRVLAQIHTQFASQTPMLIGNPGRYLFDGRSMRPTFTTLVSRVEPGGRLTLATGLAAGLSDGAEFAIYPRTASDLGSPAGRTALVRLTDVRDADSTAEAAETFGGATIAAGDQAVLLAAAVTLRRRVKFVDREGRPLPADTPAFVGIRKALPDSGWVTAAAGDEPADFAVRLSDDGTHYEICNADGTVIGLRPAVPAANTDPGVIVRRLVHLAKYRAWSELDNKAPNATLQKRIRVELLALPDDFDPKRTPWQSSPFVDPTPTVAVGKWCLLRVTNDSAATVNVAVLDLQPDWGISTIIDSGAFEPLDPSGGGTPPFELPLQVSLPDGYDTGIDTIKVIATTQPIDLRTAQLPPLDQPLPKNRGSVTRGADADPLQRLLGAIDAGAAPTRTAAAYFAPGREWAAAQCSVRVIVPGS